MAWQSYSSAPSGDCASGWSGGAPSIQLLRQSAPIAASQDTTSAITTLFFQGIKTLV
jgi:hypothetical protein